MPSNPGPDASTITEPLTRGFSPPRSCDRSTSTSNFEPPSGCITVALAHAMSSSGTYTFWEQLQLRAKRTKKLGGSVRERSSSASIDRANWLTNKNTSVSVGLKTENASQGHHLGPRDGESWERLSFFSLCVLNMSIGRL